jgi:putative photosynthetic complex assembly protein
MGLPGEDHHDEIHVPRGALIAVGALLLVSLVAVGVSRWAGVGFDSRSQAQVVAERMLRFEDGPDGTIRVIEAGGGEGRLLRVIDREGSGFLRGTLRALARERKLAGAGAQAPFRLVARADGRLTLEDPSTSERVDLESFGRTNAAAFAQLLSGARPAAAP